MNNGVCSILNKSHVSLFEGQQVQFIAFISVGINDLIMADFGLEDERIRTCPADDPVMACAAIHVFRRSRTPEAIVIVRSIDVGREGFSS